MCTFEQRPCVELCGKPGGAAAYRTGRSWLDEWFDQSLEMVRFGKGTYRLLGGARFSGWKYVRDQSEDFEEWGGILTKGAGRFGTLRNGLFCLYAWESR